MSCIKRITSQEPDVTIIVGSGKNKKEFQSYGVILAASSPYFDAMLSSGMREGETRRIEFPDKDPEEWTLVMQCMDPANATLLPDHEQSPLDKTNAAELVPWFHELQMDNYLSKCDSILAALVKEGTINDEGELTNLHSFADLYNLNYTKSHLATKLEGARPLHFEQEVEFIIRKPKIKSSKRDLTVVVGKGQYAKKYKCYATMLAFASPKLDKMISKSSGKLYLPNLMSNNWIVFYECINPSNNGANLQCSETGISKTDIADSLVSIAHTYEMSNYVKWCVDTFHGNICSCEDSSIEDGVLYELCSMLEHGNHLNSITLRDHAEEELCSWIDGNPWWYKIDDCVTRDLVRVCLPLQRVTRKEKYTSKSAPNLWKLLSNYIDDEFDVLDDEVDERMQEKVAAAIFYSWACREYRD